MRTRLLLLVFVIFPTSPTLALDLNSFRAQHKLPPLAHSATLASAMGGNGRRYWAMMLGN